MLIFLEICQHLPIPEKLTLIKCQIPIVRSTLESQDSGTRGI